jgi:hypothetical protein
MAPEVVAVRARFLAVLVTLATAACQRSESAGGGGSADAGPALTTLRVTWPDSETLLYHVDWRVDQSLVLGGVESREAQMDSGIRLVGEVSARRVRDGQGRPHLVIVLERLREAEVFFSDGNQRAGLGARDLQGARAVVEVGIEGRFESVATSRGTAPLVRQVLHVLAGELEVVTPTRPVPLAHTWSARGRGPAGEVVARYRLESTRPMVVTRERVLTRSESLPSSSFGRLELEPTGVIASLTAAETVQSGAKGQASSTLASRLSLRLQRRAPDPPPEVPWDTLERVAMDDSPIKQDPTSGLRQRVGGMTVEQAVRDLRVVGDDGNAPVSDHPAWVWQVSGLLLLHPAHARDLEGAFRDPLATPGGRALVLDLLAGAGNDACQESLRSILGDARFKKEKAYGAWVQRLSLVKKPNAETRAFTLAQHDRVAKAPLESRAPVAVALGAVAGHSRADPAARPFVDEVMTRLLKGLDAARSDDEKDAYLQAVGNTWDDRALTASLRFTRDPSSLVRSMVARNLSKYPDHPEVLDALQELVVDSEGSVSRDALNSLGGLKPTERHVDRVRDAVLAGRVPEGALGTLLNVAAGWRHKAQFGAIVQHVASTAKDPRTEARARAMLRQAPGQVP